METSPVTLLPQATVMTASCGSGSTAVGTQTLFSQTSLTVHCRLVVHSTQVPLPSQTLPPRLQSVSSGLLEPGMHAPVCSSQVPSLTHSLVEVQSTPLQSPTQVMPLQVPGRPGSTSQLAPSVGAYSQAPLTQSFELQTMSGQSAAVMHSGGVTHSPASQTPSPVPTRSQVVPSGAAAAPQALSTQVATKHCSGAGQSAAALQATQLPAPSQTVPPP